MEILLGIALGPSGLGWVKADLPVQILALVGLLFLLFLAGLEVALKRLRSHLLRLAALGFVVSLVLALSLGYWLRVPGRHYSRTLGLGELAVSYPQFAH